MSPEQARGEELDPRTDLFSAGTVLYELLAGHNPFTADSIAVTLRRVVDVEPEVPSLLDPTIPPVRRRASSGSCTRRTAGSASRPPTPPARRSRTSSPGRRSPARPPPSASSSPIPPASSPARNRRLASESAAAAERLLADRSAAPEEALWAAYRTVACAPDDAAAQTLLRTAAERAGQRERPVENPKIRELEQALRKDPDNPALLLQLAKLYRLEKDFINLMRFMRKLREVAPPDPYTQGQIAALVSTPAAAPAVHRPFGRGVGEALRDGRRPGASRRRARRRGRSRRRPPSSSSSWPAGSSSRGAPTRRFAIPAPARRAGRRRRSRRRRPRPRPDAGAMPRSRRSSPAAPSRRSRRAPRRPWRSTARRSRRGGAPDAREALLFALAEVLPRSGDADGALAALERDRGARHPRARPGAPRPGGPPRGAEARGGGPRRLGGRSPRRTGPSAGRRSSASGSTPTARTTPSGRWRSTRRSSPARRKGRR